MHSAPTVDYPVGRSRLQAGLLLAGGVALLAVDAFWFFQSQYIHWRQWLGLVASLCVILAMLRSWRLTPVGVLHWDGRAWAWESRGTSVSGSASVHLDFQSDMLLHFESAAGARHWLWLDGARARERWAALRRAAYSPREASTTEARGAGRSLGQSAFGGPLP